VIRRYYKFVTYKHLRADFAKDTLNVVEITSYAFPDACKFPDGHSEIIIYCGKPASISL